MLLYGIVVFLVMEQQMQHNARVVKTMTLLIYVVALVRIGGTTLLRCGAINLVVLDIDMTETTIVVCAQCKTKFKHTDNSISLCPKCYRQHLNSLTQDYMINFNGDIKTKLWMDTIQEPPKTEYDEWYWAKTIQDAYYHITTYWDELEEVSLDHDMGDSVDMFGNTLNGTWLMLTLKFWMDSPQVKCDPYVPDIKFHSKNLLAKMNMEYIYDEMIALKDYYSVVQDNSIKHYTEHKDTEMETTNIRNIQTPFYCSSCGKECDTMHNLKQNQAIHVCKDCLLSWNYIYIGDKK